MPFTMGLPVLLTDPGALFWAPLLTALPANTVVGGVFTDSWPGAWIPQGPTEDGSEWTSETKLEAVSVAEFFDPVAWKTTERSSSFAFALASITAKNLSRSMNGAVVSTVSGAGTTLLSKLTPVTPGAEVRCMLGWESLDATMRIICYQTIQGGAIKLTFKKVPAKATIPVQFNFEVPLSGIPFEQYFAGTTRLGV